MRKEEKSKVEFLCKRERNTNKVLMQNISSVLLVLPIHSFDCMNKVPTSSYHAYF